MKYLSCRIDNSLKLIDFIFPVLGGLGFGIFWWLIQNMNTSVRYVLTNEIDKVERLLLLDYILICVLIFCLIWIVLLALGIRPARTSRILGGFAVMPLIFMLLSDVKAQAGDFYTLLLLGFLVLYLYVTLRDTPLLKPGQGVAWRKYSVLFAIAGSMMYSLYFSLYTIDRHNSLLTSAYDFGIFEQLIYNIVHSGKPISTFYNDGSDLNFLTAVHFSPLLYLVAPFYALFQDARTLLVLQSIWLGAGAIPIYLLSKEKSQSNLFALAICLSYLIHPALHGVNSYDFHALAFAGTPLLFSLYFFEKGRYRAFLLLLLLAFLAREEISLTGIAIGVYLLCFRKHYRLGISVVLLSSLYYCFATRVILSGNLYLNRYAEVVADGFQGSRGILITIITNPLYLLKYLIYDTRKVWYLLVMFSPVCFLPILSKRRLIILVPSLLISLLACYPSQFAIHAQYPIITLALIYYCTACAGGLVTKTRLPLVALILVISSAILNANYGQIRLPHLFNRSGTSTASPIVKKATPNAVHQSTTAKMPVSSRQQHSITVKKLIERIPKDASVSGLNRIVAQLSARRVINLFPVNNDCDYLVIDTHPTASYSPLKKRRSEAIERLIEILKAGHYGVLDHKDGCYLLQKGAETGQNNHFAQLLLSIQ